MIVNVAVIGRVIVPTLRQYDLESTCMTLPGMYSRLILSVNARPECEVEIHLLLSLSLTSLCCQLLSLCQIARIRDSGQINVAILSLKTLEYPGTLSLYSLVQDLKICQTTKKEIHNIYYVAVINYLLLNPRFQFFCEYTVNLILLCVCVCFFCCFIGVFKDYKVNVVESTFNT